MSNTTLTADIIAKEAIRILDNNLVMANLVHRGIVLARADEHRDLDQIRERLDALSREAERVASADPASSFPSAVASTGIAGACPTIRTALTAPMPDEVASAPAPPSSSVTACSRERTVGLPIRA